MLRFAFKPRHPVTRVAFTADGSEVVTAQPFTGIAVRDRLTGEARELVPDPKVAEYFALMVHPEFGWIASHTDRRSVVYDPIARTVVEEQHDSKGEPVGCCGRFVSDWGEVGAFLRSMDHGTRMPLRADIRIGFTPNGRVSLWVRHDRSPQLTAPPPADVVVQLNSSVRVRHTLHLRLVMAFSANGSKLALGDGQTLEVFDLSPLSARFDSTVQERANLNPLFTLERPDPTTHGTFADKHAEHWLPPVAFDHAGRSMFTLGLRNRVQRIDLATGGVMAEWGWRCEPIRSLAVAPDDLTAAAGCQRGELVLWDLE